MNKSAILWVMLGLFFIGCQNQSLEKSPSEPPIKKVSQQAEPIILANPQKFDRTDWPQGQYTVKSIDLTGDILTIQVSYKGCRKHDFNLVAWNYFMESNPV